MMKYVYSFHIASMFRTYRTRGAVMNENDLFIDDRYTVSLP